MKVPVLRREFFEDFSASYLEMSREENARKISIEDIDHIIVDGEPIRFYTAVRAIERDEVLVSNTSPSDYFLFTEQHPECNELTTLAEMAIIAAKDGLSSLVDISDPNVAVKMPECTVPFLSKVEVIGGMPSIYMLVYANCEAVNLMNKHLINSRWVDISKMLIDRKLIGSFK